jgi:hypothetical protein
VLGGIQVAERPGSPFAIKSYRAICKLVAAASARRPTFDEELDLLSDEELDERIAQLAQMMGSDSLRKRVQQLD